MQRRWSAPQYDPSCAEDPGRSTGCEATGGVGLHEQTLEHLGVEQNTFSASDSLWAGACCPFGQDVIFVNELGSGVQVEQTPGHG